MQSDNQRLVRQIDGRTEEAGASSARFEISLAGTK
jgi:hypothetical protein